MANDEARKAKQAAPKTGPPKSSKKNEHPSDKELRAIDWVSVYGYLKHRKVLSHAHRPEEPTDPDWKKVLAVAGRLASQLAAEAEKTALDLDRKDWISILNDFTTKSQDWTLNFAFSVDRNSKHKAQAVLTKTTEPTVQEELPSEPSMLSQAFDRKQMAKKLAAKSTVEWLVDSGHMKLGDKDKVVLL